MLTQLLFVLQGSKSHFFIVGTGDRFNRYGPNGPRSHLEIITQTSRDKAVFSMLEN